MQLCVCNCRGVHACAIAVVKVFVLLLLHMCCAVQVLVEHGTEVRTGDDLVIIEAMKVRQPEPVLVASCQISDKNNNNNNASGPPPNPVTP
jgi:hypothetical protein